MSALPTVRGRVWSTTFRKRRRLWHYAVLVDGVIVNADNTADWRKIHDACVEAVEATRRIVRTGQRLRPWSDVVDEAKP